MKILITGFRHSGTTLTRLLIQAHPQVEYIFDEDSLIEYEQSKQWMLKVVQNKVSDLKKFSWGEKIPWAVRVNDKNAERAINFSKKWLSYFNNSARIVHVLRHPIDVVLSGTNSKQITDENKKTLDMLLNSVPKYIDFVNSDKRCSTLVYEELLLNPQEKLQYLFDFLNLEFNSSVYDVIKKTQLKFGGINPKRAYANRDSLDYDSVNYNDMLDILKNKI